MKPLLLILLLTGIALSGCHNGTKGRILTPVTMNKTPDQSTGDGKYIIDAMIVRKPFVNKIGKVSDVEELYISRSIDDYFIKFCESGVTREDLEKTLSIDKFGHYRSISVEIEFRDGLWDSCDGDTEVQSRSGKYVVIHRIVKK